MTNRPVQVLRDELDRALVDHADKTGELEQFREEHREVLESHAALERERLDLYKQATELVDAINSLGGEVSPTTLNRLRQMGRGQ